MQANTLSGFSKYANSPDADSTLNGKHVQFEFKIAPRAEFLQMYLSTWPIAIFIISAMVTRRSQPIYLYADHFMTYNVHMTREHMNLSVLPGLFFGLPSLRSCEQESKDL